MELVLTRIAKRKDYTIGRLKTLPQPLPVREGKPTPTPPNGEGLSEPPSLTSLSPSLGERLRVGASAGMGFGGGQLESLLCDTLEPPVLQMKTTVSQETVLRSPEKAQSLKPFAIPEGRYAVVITYSPKFQEWLPLLLGGPDFNRLFQGIRIHAGNTVKDTQGCILVGQNLKPGQVFNSRTWIHRLKQKIVEAKSRGEPVFLTIKE